MKKRYFSIDHYSVGEIFINPLEVTAKGGHIYPRLIVPININNMNPIPNKKGKIGYTVLNTQATLIINDANKTEISESIPIFQPLNINYVLSTQRYIVEFPLDSLRIKYIEERRKEDISLRFYIRFLVGKYITDEMIVSNQNPVEYELVSETMDIDIPQSHWIKKVLPEWDYLDYFLIEMPKSKNIASKAESDLKLADKAFLLADNKSVFVHCREIGTLLENSIKRKFGKESFIYKERWGRVYKYFNYYASLNLHLRDIQDSYNGEEIEIKKVDAEVVLLNTKILIKYAEELLHEV